MEEHIFKSSTSCAYAPSYFFLNKITQSFIHSCIAEMFDYVPEWVRLSGGACCTALALACPSTSFPTSARAPPRSPAQWQCQRSEPGKSWSTSCAPRGQTMIRENKKRKSKNKNIQSYKRSSSTIQEMSMTCITSSNFNH